MEGDDKDTHSDQYEVGQTQVYLVLPLGALLRFRGVAFFLIIEDKTFISKKMTTYSVWWSARNLQYP